MNIFRYVGNAIGGVNYTPTNSAIDVVVIEQPDGTLRGSPFHVNFGVRSVLHATDKKVCITVNGERTEIEMKLGKSGEGFFVKSFGAGEEPANPLSPLGTPPGSPRSTASLTRQGSTCSQKRRRFNRAKTTASSDHLCDQSESSFDPSSALSDSEIEICQHRPAKESKSVPSMGYLSDPELSGAAEDVTCEMSKSQKVIVEWKWGELPETSLNQSQSVPLVSPTNDQKFENIEKSEEKSETMNRLEITEKLEKNDKSEKTENVESPLEEARAVVTDTNNSQSTSKNNDSQNLAEKSTENSAVHSGENSRKNENLKNAETSTEVDNSKKVENSNKVEKETQSTEEESDSDDFDFLNREMEMSLCGGLHSDIERAEFDKYKISWEAYAENPKAVLDNPKLVIRDGDRYFNWSTCAAVAVGKIFFKKTLPRTQIEKLKPIRRESRSWFFFGSKRTPSKEKKSRHDESELKSGTDPDKAQISTTKVRSDYKPRKISTEKVNNNNGVNYGKTLVLTSDELKKLNLKYGKNEIRYEVTTMLQGTGVTEALIYLWKYDDKIVVSDIDGTVTKSDVVGHISNVLYIDYTHSGIHNLYDQIQRNGYKFLYLSSRGISQSHMTKSYINWTKQDGRNLPYGPILLNPSSLISALLREVWTKNPEEFKISCLEGIKTLFPEKYKTPFYAGFGNKSNDETAYTKVDIPFKRIFIIDKTGKVKTSDPNLSNFSTTYSNLEQVVDYFFPPFRSISSTSLQHLSNTFWRNDLPADLDFDLELESEVSEPVECTRRQSERYKL